MSEKRQKTLGVARGKRAYDLPLNDGKSASLVILLTGLMTFLALMALAAAFIITDMNERWSSGLENRSTVEIPAQAIDGSLQSIELTQQQASEVAALLRKHPSVSDVRLLEDAEIKDLVSPWIDTKNLPGDVPLPALVSVTLKADDESVIASIDETIKKIAPQARLDTHREWIGDAVKLTHMLGLSAFLLTFISCFITVTAISAAVNARMEVNKSEIEILHIMGASDSYIARQMQRHALIMACKGIFPGTCAAVIILAVLLWPASGDASQEESLKLLTRLSGLSGFQTLILACVPFAAAAISAITSRFSVLRFLVRMN